MQKEIDWSFNSLDIILGLVGGFVRLILGVCSFILGSYEAFKLENSLIGAFYPTSPQGRQDSDDSDKQSNDETPESQQEAQ